MLRSPTNSKPLVRPRRIFSDYPLHYVLFTLVVVAALLIWHANTQIEDFERQQQHIATKAAIGAANEIGTLVQQRRRDVRTFADEYEGILRGLALAPDHEILLAELSDRIQARFPSHLGYSIADRTGTLTAVETQPDGGSACRHDIERFVEQGFRQRQGIQAHPAGEGDHFEIMIPLGDYASRVGVFCLSFHTNALTGVLRNMRPPGHELLLVRRDRPELVDAGSEDPQGGTRRARTLDPKEHERILHTSMVRGTPWKLVSLSQPALFRTETARAWSLAWIMFLGYLTFSLLILRLIKREESRRTRAEKSRDESYGTLDAVIESVGSVVNMGVGGAVYLKDRDGRYRIVNSAFAELVEKSSNEIIGKLDEEIFPEQRARAIEKGDRQAMSTGLSITSEEVEDIGKATRTCLVTRTPHRDTKGQILGLIGVLCDITERKATESALSALAESAPLSSDDDFIHTCVRNLARAYHARYAIAAVFADEARRRIRSLALWAGDSFAPNTEYAVAGTPCQHVVTKGAKLIPRTMPQLYPQVDMLIDLGVDSYFGTPLTNTSGEVIGLVAVMDVRPMELHPWSEPMLGIFASRIALELQRSEAETALRVSERRFKEFAESAADWFWEMGPDLRFSYLQGRVAEILGIPPERILGKTRQELYANHPVSAETWKHHRVELDERRAFNDLELAWTREDGTLRVLATSGKPLFDEQGKFLGYRGVAREVTAQKLAERALRESEERFRNLVEGSIEGILIHRLWNPLFANQAYADMLGYDSPEQIVALDSISPLFAPHEIARLRAYRDARLRGEPAPIQYEYDARRKDGSTIRAENMVRLINWEGEPTIQSTAIDITQRKRAEEQARQHQAELAHVARLSTMGEMASSLAHELNQPLCAISNYCQAGLRILESDDEVTPSVRDALEQAAKQSRRAGAIIHRIRNFVRKRNATRSDNDINALVQAAVSFTHTEARERGITIELKLDRYLPPISVDGIQIEQVLLNLLRNGIEALTTPGSTQNVLSIRTQQSAQGAIQVTIKDSGLGLDEEARERVFEPFYTTKGTGMGMGLSISRSIIEAHNGRLWVESGEGAEFHFTLPISAVSTQPSAVGK